MFLQPLNIYFSSSYLPYSVRILVPYLVYEHMFASTHSDYMHHGVILRICILFSLGMGPLHKTSPSPRVT